MNKKRDCQNQGHAYYKTGPDDVARKCMSCGKAQVRAPGGPWIDAPKPVRAPRVKKVEEGQGLPWE